MTRLKAERYWPSLETKWFYYSSLMWTLQDPMSGWLGEWLCPTCGLSVAVTHVDRHWDGHTNFQRLTFDVS